MGVTVAWRALHTEPLRRMSEGLGSIIKVPQKSGPKAFLPKPQKALLTTLLVALPLIWSVKRLKAEVLSLRNRRKTDSDAIIAKMKENAPRTHWVYVQYDNEIYAFQSRLLMPPELAMVSLKRFWSDQISTEEILSTCKRYKPEQVLLRREAVTTAWKNFLVDYELIYQDKDFNLYVHPLRQK